MALKGKQKKLDKNKDGKITGADFALMRKSGYKMGGMLKASTGISADRFTNKDLKALEKAEKKIKPLGPTLGTPVGSDRMTKKDIEKASSAVGKKMGGMLKARKGKLADYERGLDFHPDPLVRSGKMSRDTYDAVSKGMDLGLGAMGVLGTGIVGFAANEARKAGKKADKRKKMRKEYIKSKGSMTQGSFRVGGLSRQRLDSIAAHRNKQAQMKKEKQKEENIRKTEISPMSAKTGDLADTMKKLRKKAYEKSMKKSKKVGRFGDDEYLIQKPLPGMKKGKMIKAKTGKSVDTIKITPTIKGKPLKARPFMKSKFDRGVMSRDYKFSKK